MESSCAVETACSEPSLARAPQLAFWAFLAALQRTVHSSASFYVSPVCLSVALTSFPSFSDHLLTATPWFFQRAWATLSSSYAVPILFCEVTGFVGCFSYFFCCFSPTILKCFSKYPFRYPLTRSLSSPS